MKKTLLTIVSVLLLVVLVACKPKTNTAPTFSGVANTSVPFGVDFDPRAGVTAYDEQDGDLTSKIEITGEVDTHASKAYTLEYRVEDSKGLEAKATRVVTVNPPSEALLANGWYDYKFATPEVKHTFFAAAEQWLLENAYAGVPLAAQTGLTLLHERIVLPVEEYVPSYGWGVGNATLTMDDAEVAAKNGGDLDVLQTPAVAGKYTRRTWNSVEPSTLNYYEGKSTTESDYGSYINGSFYSMQLNETADGWDYVPELASGEPIPINGKVINGKMTSKVWEIPIREGLKWAYNVDTDTSGFPAGHDVLNAHDFEYTYRLALDKEWFRATQGGGDFVSSKIKGAEAYSAAVARGASKTELDALWAKFGIHASEDGLTLRVEYTEAIGLFNFKYGFSMPAINQAVYEANPELYGTSHKYVASSGMYRITYWEDGVGSRYEKVLTHPLANTTQWTGESLNIWTGTAAQDNAFTAFENGYLDSVGIPNSRVAEFKEDPRVLKVPGSSIWSLNINMAGSVQAQQALWPGSTYVPEPILGNKDFRLALYFSLNRDQMIQYDAKTYPTGMKISEAYYVDPEFGVPYRSTVQGMAVGENLAYSTNGYDPEAAQLLFKKAVAAEIAAGHYEKGTAENPTKIALEVLTFDAASGAAVADNWIRFAKDGFEALVDDENFVVLEITSKKMAGQKIYDEIEAGNYDLALSSISGNTLDASSFLDVFISDNRSGFLLNYGYDSSVAEIDVKWVDENGVNRFERFSFNAIFELLNGKVFLKDGDEIKEYGSVDSIVEIFLANNDLTEVSRSEADGALLLPIIYPDLDVEGEVIPLVLVTKDEYGEEKTVLLVVVKTGNIFELYGHEDVIYADSEEELLEEAAKDYQEAEKTTVSAEDVADLLEWFEVDVTAFASVSGYFYTTPKTRLFVVVGFVDDVYVLLLTETLTVATPENTPDFAATGVTKYGYPAFNAREVDESDFNDYITEEYGPTFQDIADIFEIAVEWVHIFEFDINTTGGQRPGGDCFILVVIIAGNLMFAEWL